MTPTQTTHYYKGLISQNYNTFAACSTPGKNGLMTPVEIYSGSVTHEHLEGESLQKLFICEKLWVYTWQI